MKTFYKLKPLKKWFAKSLLEELKNADRRQFITVDNWDYDLFYKHNDKRYSIFEYKNKKIVPTNSGYIII